MSLKIFGLNGANIHHYKTYPRIVGETGGKDFIIAHSSANLNKYLQELFVLLSSKDKMFSSFTSLCTTKYVASCKEQIITDVKSMKMGSPEDFSNFVTAIHEGSFDKLASFIDQAKKIPMLKSSLEGTTINQ
jgi:1-pyrroline-5-carboxylate dehydrogenase